MCLNLDPDPSILHFQVLGVRPVNIHPHLSPGNLGQNQLAMHREAQSVHIVTWVMPSSNNPPHVQSLFACEKVDRTTK